MKTIIALLFIPMSITSLHAQTKVSWVTTSQTGLWKIQKGLSVSPASGNADADIELNQPQQKIEGFGTCFNEFGWISLSMLSVKDGESIMKELFAPGVGAKN